MCLKPVGDDTINGLIIVIMVLKTKMLRVSKVLMMGRKIIKLHGHSLTEYYSLS